MALPCYHIATPSKALLVSGRKNKDGGAAVYLNRGKFVNPLTATYNWRSLEGDTVRVVETCPTLEYVNFVFTAAVTYAVKADPPNIRTATTLYPSEVINPDTKMTRLQEFAHQTLTAHLRSVVGGMEIKTILANRDDLRKQVQTQCEAELQGVGLEIKSFRIQHIADAPDSTYLQDLSAKSRSDIRANAEIAQAQATQLAVEQQQLAEQKQAGFLRDTAINAAKLKAETDKQDAIAAQAGPLQEAQSEQAVIDMQKEAATKQGELIKAQLEADAINRSRAKATQIEIEANATKRQKEIDAEAAANASVSAAEGAARVAKQTADAEVAAAEGRARVAEQEALAAENNAKATIAEGDAKAGATRAIGEAEAAVLRQKNEAAATGDKVSIELAAIEAAPKVAEKLGIALQGGEKIFYNGMEGAMGDLKVLGDLVSNFIVGMRSMAHQVTAPETDEVKANGQVPEPAPHF